MSRLDYSIYILHFKLCNTTAIHQYKLYDFTSIYLKLLSITCVTFRLLYIYTTAIRRYKLHDFTLFLKSLMINDNDDI